MSAPDTTTTPEAPRRTPRSRKVLGCSLALLVGLVATPLGCELVARIFMTVPAIKRNQVYDPLIGFRNPSNRSLTASDEKGRFLFELNSNGFRGPELPDGPPTPGTQRVLVVGDSFVNAFAVRFEDWVGTAICGELAARGTACETFALSSDDLGTAQQLLLLRKFGERVRPTHVVLCLYPANDLANNTIELAGKTVVSPGDYFRPYLVPDGAGDFERRYARPLEAFLRHSWVFSILERRVLARSTRQEMTTRLSGEPHRTMRERVRLGGHPNEYLELYRQPPPDGDWDRAWKLSLALLEAFVDEVRALGAHPLVVVIPAKVQVETGAYALGLEATYAAEDRGPLQQELDLNLPARRLEEYLHSASIEHVMLLDELRRAMLEDGTSPFLRDGHLTGAAHLRMGRLIGAALADGSQTCFQETPESQPVGIPQLYPDGKLELDLKTGRFPEFFDEGWRRWKSEVIEPESGGWYLDQSGVLLIPGAGRQVTLGGILPKDSGFPVELVVSPAGKGRMFARGTFTEPGPFELSFSTRGREEQRTPWLRVRLRIERQGVGAGPPLRLRSLRAE